WRAENRRIGDQWLVSQQEGKVPKQLRKWWKQILGHQNDSITDVLHRLPPTEDLILPLLRICIAADEAHAVLNIPANSIADNMRIRKSVRKLAGFSDEQANRLISEFRDKCQTNLTKHTESRPASLSKTFGSTLCFEVDQFY